MSYATERRLRYGERRMARSLLTLPLVIFVAVTTVAAAYVAYVLWPRWPGPPVAPNAPSLPIVIGGVGFNVPPGAIRRPVQRRPGVQERVDLIFMWPSLATPVSLGEANPANMESAEVEREAGRSPDRIFVTIANSDGMPTPLERLKTIYTRYLSHDRKPGPAGLIMYAFEKDTPYQAEDLFYAPDMPERSLFRCTRTIGPTPGTCLHERRIGSAEITVRFPRAWIDDWRAVAAGVDRLITKLGPHAS